MDLNLVGELLRAGQYEQVAEILHAAQTASEPTADAILVQILGAACRLCLACNQMQAEAARHLQSYQEGTQREHELRGQLYTILGLIGQRLAPDTLGDQPGPGTLPAVAPTLLKAGPAQEDAHVGLWRRVLTLLGRKRSVPSCEHEAQPDADLSLIRAPEAATPPSPLAAPFPTLASARLPGPPKTVPESYAGRERGDTLSIQDARTEQRPPGEPGTPSLVVYCLGPFRVYLDDLPILEWPSNKGKSVFKYLVAHKGRPVPKDILMDVLWTDAVPDAARRNLHQAIYSARQVLRNDHPEYPHIQFENDCYLLNPAMELWLDFYEFERLYRAGQQLEASGRFVEAMVEYGTAEALYQGDFLEEDLYEDWSRAEREQMRDMYLHLANRLSEYHVQKGECHAAIALCRKLLAQDRCYEEAHRRLIRCHLAQGQRHLAVRQYQACVQALKEELDLMPSKETVELYRQITGML